MSRTGQTFFCWYFIAVSLVGVSSGGCECFGDTRVQWERSRIGYCSGCSHWFGGCAHIPVDALCHLCEGTYISVGIQHFRTLKVLCPKSRIGQYFSETALREQPVFVKFWEMQWSEWKGTCYGRVSWKIGLFFFEHLKSSQMGVSKCGGEQLLTPDLVCMFLPWQISDRFWFLWANLRCITKACMWKALINVLANPKDLQRAMFDMHNVGGWDSSHLPVKRSVERQMLGMFHTELETLLHRENIQILAQIFSPNCYFLMLKLGEFSWGWQKGLYNPAVILVKLSAWI